MYSPLSNDFITSVFGKVLMRNIYEYIESTTESINLPTKSSISPIAWSPTLHWYRLFCSTASCIINIAAYSSMIWNIKYKSSCNFQLFSHIISHESNITFRIKKYYMKETLLFYFSFCPKCPFIFFLCGSQNISTPSTSFFVFSFLFFFIHYSFFFYSIWLISQIFPSKLIIR